MQGVHCNTSADLPMPHQVAQPLSTLLQRPQLRCPEKRVPPATPPQQDALLPLQKKLRTQPPQTPLQREPELELSYASQADSEARQLVPDSADEASELPDAEVEASSQHDPQPQTASQAGGGGGWRSSTAPSCTSSLARRTLTHCSSRTQHCRCISSICHLLSSLCFMQ